jgi:hypothetical protein
LAEAPALCGTSLALVSWFFSGEMK